MHLLKKTPVKKELRENIKIVKQIKKNVLENKQWECLCPNCSSLSINSHFLQKNGVLNLLSVNNHIYELHQNDLFKIKDKGQFILKKVGVNDALSLPLFCKSHDDALFKSIENAHIIDTNNYESQIKYAYRACCSEIRRKQIIIEEYRRTIQSASISNIEFKEAIHLDKVDLELGVKDLFFYKTEFEKELFKSIQKKFTFETIQLPFIEVCASGLFSPLNFSNSRFQKEPYKTIFVNLVPSKTKTELIIGYHKDFSSEWIKNYIKEWQEITIDNVTKKITALIASRMNSWAISPDIYHKMPQKTLSSLLNYWSNNKNNLYEFQDNIEFDIFKKEE